MENWKQFYNYGRLRGAKREQAEDFAQEALLKRFQGSRQHIKHLWIDYLRETSGRSGGRHYELRKSLNNHLFTFDQFPDYRIEDFDPRMTARLKLLTLTERIITILILGWGLTQEEVANVFGMSASRISQIISKVEKRMEDLKEV